MKQKVILSVAGSIEMIERNGSCESLCMCITMTENERKHRPKETKKKKKSFF